MIFRFVCLSALWASSVALVRAQDVNGSSDYPSITRYPESVIVRYDVADFDEFSLATRKADKPTFTTKNSKRVEGKRTDIVYRLPLNQSTLAIFDSYKQALTKAGYQLIFQWKGRDCGFVAPMRGSAPVLNVIPQDINGDTDVRYLSARLPRPEGDIYASVFTLGGEKKILTRLTVVEVRPLENDLIRVSAQQMSERIRSTGRVALYGISFDTDRTDPTPASEPAIAEIARLLRTEPTLKLLVVGHTDHVGTYAYNLDLSKRRAEAIVARLTSLFQVRADRLLAVGVGYAAPVATNRTDAGKAQNRRVELVEQ